MEPEKIVQCVVAMNRGEFDVENITFYNLENEDRLRRFYKGQAIRYAQIIFYRAWLSPTSRSEFTPSRKRKSQ